MVTNRASYDYIIVGADSAGHVDQFSGTPASLGPAMTCSSCFCRPTSASRLCRLPCS
jgi:hypothetical protein